jgi:serine/threonine protein kinase
VWRKRPGNYEANEQRSVISGRWSVFRSLLRSIFGGIGKGALASYGELPYPSKINKVNQELLPNTMLSHYRVAAKIGAGGMGDIYLAEDRRLRRKVALKVLPDSIAQDKDRLRRFEREAWAASSLNHPNILTIHEFGTAGAMHFLAAEFIDGETLRSRLQSAPLSLQESVDIVVQTAQAISAAHEAGIIHRDIKPENVMIRRDGIVKLIGFGSAKPIEDAPLDAEAETRNSGLTQSGPMMATVAYMSPEQVSGLKVDARTDIFSLGVMLYEMLMRRQPFAGQTISHTIIAIRESEAPPLAREVPGELARILNQMLAKKVEARYSGAAALLADLKKVAKRLEIEEHRQFAALPERNRQATTQNTQGQTKGPLANEHVANEQVANERLADVIDQGAQKDSSLHSVHLAHVLFFDIVGYSILPIDQQTRAMQTLQQIVRQTADYKRADRKGQLVRLPAGDGMALAFLQDVTAPVRCACDIVRAVQSHREIKLRIGIHSGPVYLSDDINANRNVVGSGVNLAQRVMDCGNAGHILVSRNIAEVLQEISHWRPLLHDLGAHEVKHGVRLHLFNLYSDEVGNPAIPTTVQSEQKVKQLPEATPESPLTRHPEQAAMDLSHAPAARPVRRRQVWLLVPLILVAITGLAVWQGRRLGSANPPAPAVASLPERNLSYSLTIQKYRDGKPYQTEFQSSGREIFEPQWRFKLNLTSPQGGFLYLLNQEPGGAYTLLFPLPSRKNGSAYIEANERLQTQWYIFDDQPGTEMFRLVWAAQSVPELERFRELINPTYKGRISDPAQIQVVREFLEQHAASQFESIQDQQKRQTRVRGRGDVLVTLVELEHH